MMDFPYESVIDLRHWRLTSGLADRPWWYLSTGSAWHWEGWVAGRGSTEQ